MSNKKFKSIEKNAEIKSPFKRDYIGNIEWEGEQLQATADTKIEDDKGIGQAMVIRFFEFGVNLQAFKDHKPTAQELFDAHRKGLEAILWKDGLKPYEGIEPRIMFSKNKKFYRIILMCIPRGMATLLDKPKTLSQLLNNTSS